MGYSDHLVAKLLDEFKLSVGDAVLDPFSGSGTTAVECMKRVSSVGASTQTPRVASPHESKRLGSRPDNSQWCMCSRTRSVRIRPEADKGVAEDPTYVYLKTSGMIERGWINPKPLLDVVA